MELKDGFIMIEDPSARISFMAVFALQDKFISPYEVFMEYYPNINIFIDYSTISELSSLHHYSANGYKEIIDKIKTLDFKIFNIVNSPDDADIIISFLYHRIKDGKYKRRRVKISWKETPQCENFTKEMLITLAGSCYFRVIRLEGLQTGVGTVINGAADFLNLNNFNEACANLLALKYISNSNLYKNKIA